MSLLKFGIIIVALLLGACGSGSPAAAVSPIDMHGVSIVSQGPLGKQPEVLQASFLDVKACVLKNYSGAVQEGTPEIVILDKPFTCGPATTRSGCTDYTTIWLSNSETLLRQDYDSTFAHEAIHWLTWIGNEGHDSKLFSICEYSPWRGRWSAGDFPVIHWKE
jgi:hypothetical protein